MKKENIRLACEFVIAVCLLTIVGYEYVRPFAAKTMFKTDYQRLAVACDNAMHEEAALRASSKPSEQERIMALSAEVGLAVCHDYDKLRKRMLIWGMTDDELALFGLEALENEQIPVSRLAAPHKMDRF